MRAPFALAQLVDAILSAAQANAGSHVAEKAFAARLRSHPDILGARLRRMQYVLKKLELPRNAVVLDVGAGIGVNSVLALLCGAQEVHAVEMSEDRLRSAQIVTQALRVTDRIHVHGADVLDVELPPASFHAAFSFELLEHVRDLAGLYARLSRWLVPGARVYGRTGANGRNLLHILTFRRLWARIDRENYVTIRKQAIRRAAPDAPDSDLATLVARTRGELLPEVERIALDYARNGALPPRRAPSVPRDPISGQYMERLLDPVRSMRLIDAQGFRTQLLAPCFENLTTVAPLRALALKAAGAIISRLHPASLVVAPWLEFLSIRRAAPAEGTPAIPIAS
jgi:SAM-dependent methyltransferase